MNVENGPITAPLDPPVPTPRAGAADAESAASRFADRLNPVLLRERGEAFVEVLEVRVERLLVQAGAERDRRGGETGRAALVHQRERRGHERRAIARTALVVAGLADRGFAGQRHKTYL